MTERRLEERGAFLPEKLRGEVEPKPSIRPPWVAGLGLAGLACCAGIAVGDGGPVTWTAAALFALLLQLLTLVAGRGIERQNDRLERLRREAGEEASGEA